MSKELPDDKQARWWRERVLKTPVQETRPPLEPVEPVKKFDVNAFFLPTKGTLYYNALARAIRRFYKFPDTHLAFSDFRQTLSVMLVKEAQRQMMNATTYDLKKLETFIEKKVVALASEAKPDTDELTIAAQREKIQNADTIPLAPLSRKHVYIAAATFVEEPKFNQLISALTYFVVMAIKDHWENQGGK